MEHASVQMDRHMQQPDVQLVEAVQAHHPAQAVAHQVETVQVTHQPQAAVHLLQGAVTLQVAANFLKLIS